MMNDERSAEANSSFTMTGIATAYSHHHRRAKQPHDYPSITSVPSRKRCFPKVETVTGAMVLENAQILDKVASFLALSELYSLSMTSPKFMHRMLKHEYVIRSALLGGDKDAQITMKRLVELIRRGQIFVPSPVRMLRLARGKRCEFCHAHRVEHVSRYFGVFGCFQGDCRSREYVAHITIQERGNNNYYDDNQGTKAYVEHPRVAKDMRVQTGKHRKVYIWKRPLLESMSSNQFYGPIITLEHMQTWSRMKKTQFLVPEQEFLNKYLKDVDGEDDEHKISAQSIFRVYDMYEKRLRMQKQQQSARDKLNQARMQGTLFVISALSQMLGEVPWRSAIFTYQLTKYYAQEETETDVVIARFKSPLVEEALHPFAMDPHKATREQLKKVAAHLQRQFGLIWSKKFDNLDFLWNDSQSRQHQAKHKGGQSVVFEEMLHRQMRRYENGASKEDSSQLYMLCNRASLKLIRQNMLVEALYLLLPSRVRLAASREIVDEYFQKYPHSNVEKATTVNAHRLACGLWDFVAERQQKSRQPLQVRTNVTPERHHAENNSPKCDEIVCADPRVVYQMCQTNFPKVFQAAWKFVQYATKRNHGEKSGDIANRVWSGKPHIIESLFQQDFRRLRLDLERS